jgi:hypothetical protein
MPIQRKTGTVNDSAEPLGIPEDVVTDAAAGPLLIIYEVTEDCANSAPWPPDGSDFWSIVERVGGFTKWRRIALIT